MLKLGVFLALVLTALVSYVLLIDSGTGVQPVAEKRQKEWVEVEQVDKNDLAKVELWAKGICRGVSVKEAAEALNVDPSLPSVISALTESLPETTRERAAAICRAELIT